MVWLRNLLPDSPLPVRILSGPFRGAHIVLRPRSSMRKILGIYEHELNSWLTSALRRVDRVIDVGANDGYFTIGCAAAFRRMGKSGEILALEPSEAHCRLLERSARPYLKDGLCIRVSRTFAGSRQSADCTTLDSVTWQTGEPASRKSTLIKIDVEGAEEEVLDGARSFIAGGNPFLIEVHRESFLDSISARFAQAGLRLRRIDQRPFPLLGRETRSEENWWLVSELE